MINLKKKIAVFEEYELVEFVPLAYKYLIKFFNAHIGKKRAVLTLQELKQLRAMLDAPIGWTFVLLYPESNNEGGNESFVAFSPNDDYAAALADSRKQAAAVNEGMDPEDFRLVGAFRGNQLMEMRE